MHTWILANSGSVDYIYLLKLKFPDPSIIYGILNHGSSFFELPKYAGEQPVSNRAEYCLVCVEVKICDLELPCKHKMCGGCFRLYVENRLVNY